MADYFRLYERIDVALDPFPYGGGTTTCDALWMGVPVVSLAGQTAVGRGGLSILVEPGVARTWWRTTASNTCRSPRSWPATCRGWASFAQTLRQRMQSFAADGRPAFCAERRGRLPRDVAAVLLHVTPPIPSMPVTMALGQKPRPRNSEKTR